jgi:hypothetical protein
MDIVKDTIFHSAISYKYNNYSNIQLSLYLSLSMCPICPVQMNTYRRRSFLGGCVVCVVLCVCFFLWGSL